MRCDICGGAATQRSWDVLEIDPIKNFLGLWCRQFSPIEPGFRRCRKHLHRVVRKLRFASEQEWQDWQEDNP